MFATGSLSDIQFRPLLTAAVCGLFIVAACGAEEGVDQNAPLQHQAEVKLAQADTAATGSGADLYQKNCAACHQVNGQGLAGAFPPLAKSDYFAGKPERLMEATIKGLSGPLTVNGVEYNNVMPAVAYLSDADLAEILTYVNTSWGNAGRAVTAQEVNAYRAEVGLARSSGAG